MANSISLDPRRVWVQARCAECGQTVQAQRRISPRTLELDGVYLKRHSKPRGGRCWGESRTDHPEVPAVL